MNSKSLLPILVVLIISPFFVLAQGEHAITDELGILGIHKNEIEGIIKNISDTTDVEVRVYISSETFDEKDFYSIGNYTYYYEYNLDKRGNPVYNVLVFYAKVDKNYRLGYFHSSPCEPFVEFLETLKQGDVGQGLSGGELLTIIEKLSQGIKYIMEEYGDDCKVPSEEPEEIEKIEVTKGNSVFLIDDNTEGDNWQHILSLYPLTTYHYIPEKLESVLKDEKMKMIARKNNMYYSPTLVYHREGDDIDYESTYIFLEQFKPKEIVLVHKNGVPEKLKLAVRDLNLDLEEDATLKYINVDNYSEEWNKKGYEYVIVSENDYKTGLLASVFASYFNAPLLFSDSENIQNYDFDGKNVYYIGRIASNTNSLIDSEKPSKITKYTLEELQKEYSGVNFTNTDKVILVNPEDIKDEYCEQVPYRTTFGRLEKSYCKDSLVSPLLATIKNELIVPIDVKPLEKIIKKVRSEDINEFYVDDEENLYAGMSNYGYIIGRLDLETESMETFYAPLDEVGEPIFIPQFTMSPNGQVYAIQSGEYDRETGKFYYELVNIGKDKVDKIFRSIDIPFAANKFGIDDNRNSYFLVPFIENHTVKRVHLKKFDTNGNLLYDKLLFETKELEDYVRKMENAAPDLRLYQVRFFVKSRGVYIVMLLQKELESYGDRPLTQNDEENFGYVIVYKFDENAHAKNWFEDKSTYKAYKNSFIFEEAYMGHLNKLRIYTHLDDDENVFITKPPSTLEKYPEQQYYGLFVSNKRKKDIEMVESFERMAHESNLISSNKDKVYIIYTYTGNKNVIRVLDKQSLLKGEIKRVKFIRGREECEFFERNLNSEKYRFERSVYENFDKIKTRINDNLVDTGGEYKYLTVFASPRAIPLSSYLYCIPYGDEFRSYLDVEYVDGTATGRIFGITVSDTSSYINRIAAFSERGEAFVPSGDRREKFRKVGLLADAFPEQQTYIPELKKKLSDEDYEVSCAVGNETLAKNGCVLKKLIDREPTDSFFYGKDIVIYDDHGKVDSLKYLIDDLGYSVKAGNLKEFKSSLIMTQACSVGNYYSSHVDSGEHNLFASNIMRKGGLGFFGGVSIVASTPLLEFLVSKIFDGYDLGNALNSTLHDKSLISEFEKIHEIIVSELATFGKIKKTVPNVALFGDPTLKPALLKKVNLTFKHEPVKAEGEKGYACYAAAGGGKRCYKKGYYKFSCAGGEITCRKLKTQKPSIKGIGQNAYVLFKDDKFIQAWDSMGCLDYEGDVLSLGTTGDVYLGEMVCNTDEGKPVGNVKISKLIAKGRIGVELVSVNPQ